MVQQKENISLMDKLISLCKRRGFIFPGSEIYGGLANSWDYGPLGAELKKNIKDEWWRMFVRSRSDMVGVDTALVMNPKVWEASGHLQNFTDPLVECKKCHERYREDNLPPELVEGKHICPNCGGELTAARQFNMMFKTFIGPVDPVYRLNEFYFKLEAIDAMEISNADRELKKGVLKNDFFQAVNETDQSTAYLRPETAQGMFVNFGLVSGTTRKRLPFGIAQMGKAFRNEITPGNFIFRTREFEQMEIEYFIRESDWKEKFEMWLTEMKKWLAHLGIAENKLHYAEIPDGERAHYSKRTVDIEYEYPFGRKELYGLAYRGDFDLANHMKASGEDLRYADPETGEKFLPHVIEPTWGVDRSVLVAMLEAYHEEEAPTSKEGETEARVVMKFPKWLAPFKVAVLPLSKKEELAKIAEPIYDELRQHFVADYDESQSIGKRYRRQDEIGTPYCVTVDFETAKDNAVTVRDRDTMKQERIAMKELVVYLREKFVNPLPAFKRRGIGGGFPE